MQEGVNQKCMSACTFDIDIGIIEALPDPLLCTMDLPKFVSCAAGNFPFTNHSFYVVMIVCASSVDTDQTIQGFAQ